MIQKLTERDWQRQFLRPVAKRNERFVILLIMTTVQRIEFCFENSRNETRNVLFYYPERTLFERTRVLFVGFIAPNVMSGNTAREIWSAILTFQFLLRNLEFILNPVYLFEIVLCAHSYHSLNYSNESCRTHVYQNFLADDEKMIENALTTTTTSRVKLEHARKFDTKLFSCFSRVLNSFPGQHVPQQKLLAVLAE